MRLNKHRLMKFVVIEVSGEKFLGTVAFTGQHILHSEAVATALVELNIPLGAKVSVHGGGYLDVKGNSVTASGTSSVYGEADRLTVKELLEKEFGSTFEIEVEDLDHYQKQIWVKGFLR